ncbi:MAG: hypothetical protein MZV70_01855 [Desulfobacterales bacterium]|nr:hypothetical protein [Desulfobacterales bacterium]
MTAVALEAPSPAVVMPCGPSSRHRAQDTRPLEQLMARVQAGGIAPGPRTRAYADRRGGARAGRSMPHGRRRGPGTSSSATATTRRATSTRSRANCRQSS